MAIMVYRDKNTLWAAKIHFFNTGNTLLFLWGLAGLDIEDLKDRITEVITLFKPICLLTRGSSSADDRSFYTRMKASTMNFISETLLYQSIASMFINY